MTDKRKSKWGRSEKAERALRLEHLSAPIRERDITNFVRHLVAVSFGSDSECWLYSVLGEGDILPDDLKISTKTYAHLKFNGETVNAHQFAYCASRGMNLAQLSGFDVHHATKRGRCIGYRCVNPDHLDIVPSDRHRGTRGNRATLAPFQTKIVREVLEVPPNQRRPPDRRGTGTNDRTRWLGNVAFLIKGGVIDGILEIPSEEPPLRTP